MDTVLDIEYINMRNTNSLKDTVSQQSVKKSNNSQKRYQNYKRNIIRWFKGLMMLSIKRKIIYFMIIMTSCFLLYLIYNNRVLQEMDKKDLKDTNFYQRYNRFGKNNYKVIRNSQSLTNNINKNKNK